MTWWSRRLATPTQPALQGTPGSCRSSCGAGRLDLAVRHFFSWSPWLEADDLPVHWMRSSGFFSSAARCMLLPCSCRTSCSTLMNPQASKALSNS